MTPLRLRTRLALVFGAGFAVLLGLGALALYLSLARTYRRDFDRGLLDAKRSGRALFSVDRNEFTTAAQTATHVVGELVYGDRTLVAFDSAGQFLAASQRIPGEPYFNDVPAAGLRDRPTTMTLREGPARVIGVRMESGVQLAIAMNTLPLDRRLVHLRRVLATVLPVILVFGAVIGAWGSRWVLRPIIRVAQTAERIGEEVANGAVRFDRLPPSPAGDELTTLTDAFNLLVDRLGGALERERGVAERQRRFLSDAAHELRTPVTILRSEAEVTLRGDGDAPAYRQAMERIAAEANELGTLVADLLLMARGDARAISPSRQRVYLDDLVNDVIARCRKLPMASGREIRRGQFEAAPVEGDATLLERALLALVHNALVHAPGSPIELSTGVDEDGGAARSWARVRDWGPGIPAAERERIFERFARLNSAAPGNGLGLPIARAIAEAHGGELRLDEVATGVAFTLVI
ncbi:MAG TPA: HAMP domain-containing sensor histidine kinase [Gemmatimonadales bacterium]|jgi:signal transduction histidine kinase